MKTKIQIAVLIFTALCLAANSSKASDDFEKAMLKAKANLKTAMNTVDVAKLTKVRGEFERILQLKEMPWLVNYYIAYADYGLAMSGMESSNTDVIKKYTQSGINVINKSIEENPDFADAFVLLEALNFNRWQYESDKMQDIMSATQSADASVKALEPENPRYVLVNAVSHYWTPEQFGGGVKVAMPEFEKAKTLFEKRVEKGPLYPDWGQEMNLGYLALCYIKRNDDGDKVKAKSIIDEALKVNPDSGFIKEYVQKEYDKVEK